MLKTIFILLYIAQLFFIYLSSLLLKTILTSVQKRLKIYLSFAKKRDKNVLINIFLTKTIKYGNRKNLRKTYISFAGRAS